MIKPFLILYTILLSIIGYGQCHYTIDMQDSYGDGWNGASVDVSEGIYFIEFSNFKSSKIKKIILK